MKILKKENIYKIASGVLLLVFFASILLFLNKNFSLLLDSDMASELMLSKILNTEKTILTTNWFYSTEIRVLNTQLVFAPLFSIFESWHRVRIVGTAILLFLLLISFLYMCKKLNLKNNFILALYVVGSISAAYKSFVIVGTYYIPHIIISYITIGLLSNIFKNKRLIFTGIILALLSLTAGMGGLRQLMVLYIPLLISAFIYLLIKQYNNLKIGKINFNTQSFKLFFISFITMIFSTIGYLINSLILQNKFKFFSYEKIHFSKLKFDSIEQVLNGWLNVFGYNNSGEVISKTPLITNLLFAFIIGLIIISCIYAIKHKEKFETSQKFVILFFVINVVVISALFTFTDTIYLDRYLLPVSCFFVPVIGAFLTNYKVRIYKVIILFIIIFHTLFGTYTRLTKSIAKPQNTEELIFIKDVLISYDSYEGYASFWSANILTELSDGKINVWDFGDAQYCLHITDMYKWLQIPEHIDNPPTSHNIFVVLKRDEADNTHFTHTDRMQIIYESDTRIVYLFNSYEDLEYCLNTPDEN